jgi:hypothetical protein
MALTNLAPALFGDTAIVDFDNVTWPAASLTARGALIYNYTKGLRSIAVIDFGVNVTSTNGNFTLQFPTPDAVNALIRLT